MYSVPQPCPRLFRFDDFAADTRAAQLRRDGNIIPLQDVPFRFLVALLARPGELVDREQLRESIWPADLNLDFEVALNSAASKVRRALGDPARAPRFLETVQGKGYRFLGEVSASPAQNVPDFDPRCVAVAPFENRTGDSDLDSLGSQAVDLVEQDLLQADDLKVANHAAAFPPGDPLRQLAQATRARYVVTGAYYLRGGGLEFQARVVDPWAGKVVYALGPWRAPREDPAAALGELRQTLGGALAWVYDPRVRSDWEGLRPPRLDAFLAFRKGRACFSRDDAAAMVAFQQALALDPRFFLARFFLFFALRNHGRWEEAAETLVPAEEDAGRLTPVERLMLRWLRAELEGRPMEVLAVFEKLKAIHPATCHLRFMRSVYELAANRNRSAIRSLTGIPPTIFWESPNEWWAANSLCHAHHLVGEYTGQLQLAREAQAQFPDVLNFRAGEIDALIAMDRLEEAEAAILDVSALPFRPGFAAMLPWQVTLAAVFELRAHGHREASRRLAARVLDDADARGLAGRWIPSLLVCLDRPAEALELRQAQAAKDPEDLDLLGALGALLARLGRAAEARGVEADLSGLARPGLHGGHTFWRACIAAQLGERDRAVGLLGQAFAQGYRFSINLHRDLNLEPLRNCPGYEKLVRPRD